MYGDGPLCDATLVCTCVASAAAEEKGSSSSGSGKAKGGSKGGSASSAGAASSYCSGKCGVGTTLTSLAPSQRQIVCSGCLNANLPHALPRLRCNACDKLIASGQSYHRAPPIGDSHEAVTFCATCLPKLFGTESTRDALLKDLEEEMAKLTRSDFHSLIWLPEELREYDDYVKCCSCDKWYHFVCGRYPSPAHLPLKWRMVDQSFICNKGASTIGGSHTHTVPAPFRSQHYRDTHTVPIPPPPPPPVCVCVYGVCVCVCVCTPLCNPTPLTAAAAAVPTLCVVCCRQGMPPECASYRKGICTASEEAVIVTIPESE